MPLFNTPQFQLDDRELQKKRRLFGSSLSQTSDLPPQLTVPQDDEEALPVVPQPQMAKRPDVQTQDAQPQVAPMDSKPSLKQRLFGYSGPTQTDEYGLQKPTKQHEGLFSTVLKYALPAVTGLAGGVGILPGLASAYAGESGREGREQAQQQGLYNAQRKEALNSPKGIAEQLSHMTPDQQAAVNKYKHGDNLLQQLLLAETINKNRSEASSKADQLAIERAKANSQIDKDKAEVDKLKHPGLTQRISDVIGDAFDPDTGTPSPQPTQPSTQPIPPKGTTHKVPGSDGHMYFVDAKGSNLGRAD